MGLIDLVNLAQMKVLDIRNTKVTDAGLKQLANLKQLTTLELGGTKVTDAGIKELRTALPKCLIFK